MGVGRLNGVYRGSHDQITPSLQDMDPWYFTPDWTPYRYYCQESIIQGWHLELLFAMCFSLLLFVDCKLKHCEYSLKQSLLIYLKEELKERHPRCESEFKYFTQKYFDHSPQGGQKCIIILECIPEDKNNFKKCWHQSITNLSAISSWSCKKTTFWRNILPGKFNPYEFCSNVGYAVKYSHFPS